MVINSSHRSPSPMSIRSNTNHNHNPNPRINQEREVLDVRKSFTFAKSSINGQPRSLTTNTPVNSPSEFVRRCSMVKEGGNSIHDHHEKENERDPNSKPIARVHSPSAPKTKNFMSPTISAASKINPSPKKKVLGERNEAIRASASLSEGNFHFFSTGPLDCRTEIGSKEDMVTPPPCSKEPETKATDFEKLEFEPDLVVLSPEVGMNNAKPSTTITPFDADASLPPYDPNVNFLSPRPQFLHYKPKPRIESYIIDQSLRFDDGISSESETEISEEVQSEDISSSTSVEASPVVEKSLSPELSSPSSQQLDENVNPKIKTRPTRFGGMWKVVCLIILISLGFVAVYQENIVLENFNGLLSKDSFEAKEVKFIPLHYANVSAWGKEEVENYMVQDYVLRPAFDRKEEFVLRPSILGEEIELDSLDDYEAEMDEFVEELERAKLEENYEDEESVIEDDEFAVEDAFSFTELENQEGGEHDITSEVHDDFQSDFKLDDHSIPSIPQAPEVQLEIAIVDDLSIKVQDDFQLDFKVDDQSLPSLPQAPEVLLHVTTADGPSVEIQDDFKLDFKIEDQLFPSVPEAPKVQQEVVTTSELVIEASDSLVVPEAIDEGMSQIDETVEGSFSPGLAAASLFIVSILAAITFMVVKTPKKEIIKEKSAYISAPRKTDPKVHDNQNSWIGPVEVDMMGESCPSQISSLQKTSSYNLKGSSEAQSMDKNSKRNYKRESFAASSSDYTMSSSYGSFTTYSILHSKQRDDEVVTPVRRSSRIRGKVASP